MKGRIIGAAIAGMLALPTTAVSAQARTTSASSDQAAYKLATPITPNGSWPVYHSDDGHTGFDPNPPTAVTATTGWSSSLDAAVYAEPLVYQGIVYAATLNNTVYALNQTDGSVVWSNHLRMPETTGWACGNVSPQGILGTPVIDPGTGRIYAATLGADDVYRLEGLNLTTGVEELNTAITTPAAGFDWTIEQERGALAVRNGYVYVPFGGRAGDCGNYHGYIFAVPTNGSAVTHYYQTPGSGAGFWTAGGVVVDDSTGKVFDTSGNGVSSGCNANPDGTPVFENDAVVRLSATLAHEDAFIPQDWQANWCSNDQDLGSASMVLISPTLAFQAGKWGNGFLLNPQSLAGMDGQLYPTPKPDAYGPVDVCFGDHSDANFGSYAYFAPYVYLSCDGHGLVGLKVTTTAPVSFSACDATCAAPSWKAGGTTSFGPPIVAGNAVWAVSTSGGGLYGFATSTGNLIFHSGGFAATHFTTPSEAGGQIFVGSGSVLRSFNMVSGCRSATLAANPPSSATVGSTVIFTAGASGCPSPNPLFQFWTLAPGATSWTLAQAYSTNAAFTWNTAGLGPGQYSVNVWARDANSSGAYGNANGRWDAYSILPYTLATSGTPCSSARISASPTGSAVIGTTVTVTGQAGGCSNPQYQFWTLAPGATTWQLAQAYSSAATFNWSTTGLSAGTWGLDLWIRDASSSGVSGNSSGRWDAYAILQYTLTAPTPSCTGAALSASPASPALVGTIVVFTGRAAGCANPLYEFWALAPGATSWQLAQAYSSTATFNWSTAGLTPGTYSVGLWVRDTNSGGVSGNSSGRWDAYAFLQYRLTSMPCTGAGMTASPASPVAAGAAVTFTARATGCPNPQHEFWTLAPGATTWQLAQSYSTNATFAWDTTALAAGTYQVAVWVRDTSSTGTGGNSSGTWDAYSFATYQLT
jgi:hypothetical protein